MQYGQLLENIKTSPLSKEIAIKKYAFVEIVKTGKSMYSIKEIGANQSVFVSARSYARYIKDLNADQIRILGLLHE